MKRSELTVGAELYYAKPYEWTHHSDGDRAVVLAVEPYHQTHEWGARGSVTEVRTGNGVLVDLHRSNGYVMRRIVVSLGHLRGPYVTTLAETQERWADARDARSAEHARRIAIAADAGLVVQRAKNAGYDASLNLGGDLSPVIRMTPETLTRLLDAAGA